MESRTIGIIGGGQLGRMLAIAASRLNFKTLILDPQPECPAAQLANQQIVAAYDDHDSLMQLSQQADIITYEFENVPVHGAEFLAHHTQIFPPPEALALAQDRLIEKQFFAQCAIPTAPWWPVDDEATLHAAFAASKGDAILKTRRLGYDGKGQVRINHANKLAQALVAIDHAPAILEGLVSFEREISILAARSANGEIVFFDIPENTHSDGILRTSHVPAPISPKTVQTGHHYVRTMLEKIAYVGVIGVEFFVLSDGTLIANEFAPRVHNSGHWTEAVCSVSQFDLHIRAISGLALVTPRRHSDCVMENLIGEDILKVPHLLKQENLLLHLYGKTQMREGRKMGHFTRILT